MITRFQELFNTKASPDPIEWPALFKEFSQKRPFLGQKHPGWSPAEFDPPSRSLDNVKRIGALVLDYDNKTTGGDRVQDPVTIDAVEAALADFYGLIHTSRNHTHDWPRFRVILPLTRTISKMEYTLLWQRASRLWPGLDPQPKDPSRFWYEPGVGDHPGAEFEAVTLCGAFLDPDAFADAPAVPLAITPANDGERTNRETRARAYIERMPEAVSGAGGHSALWSVARKLICDFELDEQSAYRLLVTEYNPRCQPPWSDKELKHKVHSAMTKARVRNPVQDRTPTRQPEPVPSQARLFQPPAPGTVVAEPADISWMKYLRYNSQDQLTKDVGNAALILKNAPGWQGSLMFDAMAFRVLWFIEPQYDVGIQKPREGSMLQDHHLVYVQQVLAKFNNLSVGKDIVWAAIEAAAHENEIHPVQDYLESLEWDGKPRIARWLHTYLGATDSEYNAAVGRWWLISAVARAFRPGCQADHVLILEGAQGKGKSQAIRALGDPWYLGSLPDIRDAARAADTIGGYWLVEIAELDALKGAASTRVKEFVSQQKDVYRKAYGRSTLERPRSCVFVGTTNETNYLSDPTGARRFWPVRVDGKVDRDGLAEDRDQLWAETVTAWRSGEQWHPHEEYYGVISEEQADRFTEDDWTEAIARWVRGSDAELGFTSSEILGSVLNLEMKFWDKPAQMRVGSILTKLGFMKRRVTIGGERAYRYYRAQPRQTG